jgi:cytochrome c
LLAGIALRAHGKTAPPGRQVERGREIYEQMCAVCHGPNGEGYRAGRALDRRR